MKNLLIAAGLLSATISGAPSLAGEESIAAKGSASVSEELVRLYDEDQADRNSKDWASIDWSVVKPRDDARKARIKEIYTANLLQTGEDYYRAAMILQHSEIPEDYLLAHEFCVVAISKGQKEATWLAAASEDRFLISIGRAQRFGTQYGSDGPGATVVVRETDPQVTDELRSALGVPSLEKARENAADMNEKPGDRVVPEQVPVANDVSFAGDFVNEKATEVKPVAISHAELPFPRKFRHTTKKGDATVAFIVELDGSVSAVQVERASDAAYGDVAAKSVAKWKFSVGSKDGKPVRVAMRMRFSFPPPEQ